MNLGQNRFVIPKHQPNYKQQSGLSLHGSTSNKTAALIYNDVVFPGVPSEF